jgi:hypothetical protein
VLAYVSLLKSQNRIADAIRIVESAQQFEQDGPVSDKDGAGDYSKLLDDLRQAQRTK